MRNIKTLSKNTPGDVQTTIMIKSGVVDFLSDEEDEGDYIPHSNKLRQ